jgi:acetyl esterase/lipase
MRFAFKVLVWLAASLCVLAVLGFVAWHLSPWPRAMLIRYAFYQDTLKIVAAQEKHVPPGIGSIRDERYDALDRDALLDVFFLSDRARADRAMPTIVWVHGGGWVSGTKDQIANYAKVLAARGFTVVSVNYSVAPEAKYPTPVRQANAALGHLVKNAERLNINTANLVLAGDSAGAHITSQLANVITVPEYAKALGIVPVIAREQLAGMLLYCGPYTTEGINLDGPFGNFLTTVLWSYSGTSEFRTDPYFQTAWILNHVTADFPPTFISAGNADPLLPQSVALADKLSGLGVRVERLFFPKDHVPPLQHEYQFDLDTVAGQFALERSVAFLSGLKR